MKTENRPLNIYNKTTMNSFRKLPWNHIQISPRVWTTVALPIVFFISAKGDMSGNYMKAFITIKDTVPALKIKLAFPWASSLYPWFWKLIIDTWKF